MGRDREGRVGGAVAAQAVLSMARAGLEPRRQPDDQRHDQGPLARGAGGGGSGGIILRRHCEEHQRRSNLQLSTRRDDSRRLLSYARQEHVPRSEERRGGNEWVSTWTSRGTPDHNKKT